MCLQRVAAGKPLLGPLRSTLCCSIEPWRRAALTLGIAMLLTLLLLLPLLQQLTGHRGMVLLCMRLHGTGHVKSRG